MAKNIYGLLNEMEMDFNEYENVELSSEEKERYKSRILMEVKRMDRKKGKSGKMWKKVTAAVAACAITAGAVGFVNPVRAQEIFSDVFGKLIENAKGEKYEKEDTEKFTKIGGNAVAVQEEIEKQQEGDYVTTAEKDGVTLSVSDVYCDGYMLYFTTSLKTDREDLNQADGIVLEKKVGETYRMEIDGVDMASVIRPFEKSADGTFVAVQQMELMDPYSSKDKPIDLGLEEKETVVVDWTVTNLWGHLWDKWDENGEYVMTGAAEGEWHLRFPVTIDRSQNQVFDINKEENGILVKQGTKTKAGLLLEIELPDFRKEPYNDKYNDPNLAIKDSEGNYLQWLDELTDLREDGTATTHIMVLYDGQKDLSFEVTTRDKYNKEIANIGFQVP